MKASDFFSTIFFLSWRLEIPPLRIGGVSVLWVLGSMQAKQNQTHYFNKPVDQNLTFFPVVEPNQYWNIRVNHTLKILNFHYPVVVKSAQDF